MSPEQSFELTQLFPFLTPIAFMGLAWYLKRSPHNWPQLVAFIPTLLGLASVLAGVTVHKGEVSPGALVYIDLLSLSMLLLISTIGGAVLVYSRQYLQGDPKHATFMSQLALIFAAVSTLVIAGNLYLMMLCWVAMSLCLHRLLNFRSERPGARLAARSRGVGRARWHGGSGPSSGQRRQGGPVGQVKALENLSP